MISIKKYRTSSLVKIDRSWMIIEFLLRYEPVTLIANQIYTAFSAER